MESSDGFLSPRVRSWLTPLLLILGVQCWLILGGIDYGLSFQRKLLLAAAIVSLIPPINRWLFLLLDRIRHPSRPAAIIAAIVMSILAAIYFPITAHEQGRAFIPKWQDEFSYLIQIHLLARGRLWMHMHPLADFFDSFQLIVKPVYASMYFPGASLLYVPSVWLHFPYWIISTIIAGCCVGLMYLIMTDLIDGVAGALAALMLLSLSLFREVSVMVLGHPAIILLGLAMIWSWLNWRKNKSLGWAVILGIFSGWAAITRPLDAVVLTTPIGIDILFCLYKNQPRRKTFAAIVAGAAPFLILQIVFNIGVTGSWYRTPFQFYADRDYPGTGFGFHPFDPNLRPLSHLPQKQKFHNEWTIPAIKNHQPANVIHNWLHGGLQALLADTLPHRLMIIFLPLSFLGLGSCKRRTVWWALPWFVILFSFYTWYLSHYALITLPAMFLMVLLGARELENAWPRLRRIVGTFVTMAIVILCVSEMVEFNRMVKDEIFDPPGLRDIDAKLANLPHEPAIVLFHFPPSGNPHEEPVYNADVAWPDDAPIIRAHDLGDRNVELFEYYAQHQPLRAIYLYDRGDGSLKFMGFAGDRFWTNRKPL